MNEEKERELTLIQEARTEMREQCARMVEELLGHSGHLIARSIREIRI